MASLAIFPYALLARGIYAGLIGTISTATMRACGVVKSIYTHKNPDATKLIIELDIERRLRLIQSVLNKIDNQTKQKTAKVKLNDLEKTQIFELIGEEADLDDDPIDLCLMYLYETIQNIHNDLSAINKKIAHHNTKWFSAWRTLNIKSILESLKLHSKLLDSRFEDLTKISNFLNSLN